MDSGHLRDAWAEELGIPISDELWEEGLSSIQSCSINSRFRLIQFKVLHRLHYSKTKLSKIYPSVSPMCDRCGTAEGSLSHLFWQCPIITTFWGDIFNWFSRQMEIVIQPDCCLAIFGCSDETRALPSHQKQMLRAGMVAAKKCILVNWKSPTSPCFKRWLNEMLSVAKLEQIRHDGQNTQTKFQKMWRPFLALLDSS